jgi:general secretion pathway protein H
LRDHLDSSRAETRAAGFTLLEMLVVLTIIALLAAAATPRLKLGGGQRLRSAAYALAVDLRLLRAQATRHGTATTLALATNGYLLIPGGRRVSLPADITIEFSRSSAMLVTDATEEITFFADGSSAGGLVTLHQGGAQAHIAVRGFDGWVRPDDDQP